MRTFLFAAAIAVSAIACGTDLSTHVNALTGKRCDPDGSYQPKKSPKAGGPSNPKCQGTSNGDNCDDLSSGKIDCIGDGNSGQGDDKKHNCMFPQPGCDENGCCDDDLVEPPPTDPDDPGSGDPDDPDGDPVPPGSTDPTPPDSTDPTDPTGPLTTTPARPQATLERPPTGPIL